MKSKIKSLLFCAAFFFLFICILFGGIGVLIVNEILQSEYYSDLTYNVFVAIGYLLVAIYIIFTFLIFTNKLPEKIKRFEKIRYLMLMFILLIWELGAIGSVMYDFN